MAFIRFTAAGQSFSAKVSINPRGSISFTRGARLKYKLNDFTHAILFYDLETQRIGIQFTSDPTQEGAIKLRFRDFGADLAAKAFIDLHQLPIRKTTAYPILEWDEGGILIDLNQGRERKESSEDQN